MKKSPAFQFYPKDFLSDEKQMVMELAEAGAYVRLMCVCWKEGSIPADLRRLAKLCGAPSTRRMRTLWPAIEPCFREHPDDATRLIHPRLEEEREKQENFTRKMSEAGQRGARKRHGRATDDSSSADSGQRTTSDDKSSASDVEKSNTGAEDRLVEEEPTARAKKPQSNPSQALARPQPGHSQALASRSSSTREPSSAASAESSETPEPRTSTSTAAGGDVENSDGSPQVSANPPTIAGMALEAHQVLGLGAWGDDAGSKFNETKSIIRRYWHGRGVGLESLWAAIRGTRLLVDRGEISWLADRQGKPLDGLEVLLKEAVVPGPDGDIRASVFAHGERAWRERELVTPSGLSERGGGLQRVSVGAFEHPQDSTLGQSA